MTTANLKLQCPPFKRGGMYLAILGAWIISSLFLWLDFANSLHVLDSIFDQIVAGIVAFFINLGWLFGFYHLGLVSFTLLQSNSFSNECDLRGDCSCTSPIAILHTVCDDFQEKAVLSCITQEMHSIPCIRFGQFQFGKTRTRLQVEKSLPDSK